MKQTEQTSSVVRSQLLPLTGMNLVLPNTSIAEVISLPTIEPIKNSPDWLLGIASWRGVHIPIISFERANKVRVDENSKMTRIAVLNSTGSSQDLPFYGVITQGIPKLLAVEKADINAVEKPDVNLPIAQQQTMINETSAVIPDQKQIESMLKKEGIKLN